MPPVVFVLLGAAAVVVVFWLNHRLGQLRAARDELAVRLERSEAALAEAEKRLAREGRERPRRERQLRIEQLEAVLTLDDHVQRALEHAHDADPDVLRQGLELL